MYKYLDRGNDYQILFKIKDNDKKPIALSFFSDYEVVLEDKDGVTIRTYKTSNSESDGKLYEYDSYTLEFYIETRDTDTYNEINAYVKTEYSESKLYDNTFDNKVIIDNYNVRS